MHDRDSSTGVVQYMLQRRSLQRWVHRDVDRAEIIDSENHPERQRAGRQHQDDMVVLADAELVQITGKAGDLFQSCAKVQRSPPSNTAKMSCGLVLAWRSIA